MKNFRKNALKSSKGITLIALVITIIVLLILAGISISMLSGDNSLLKRAGEARDKTGLESLKEEAKIVMSNRTIENTTIGTYSKTLKQDLESGISGGQVEEIAKADGTTKYTDVCYVSKNGQTITVYEDGEVAEGKVSIWKGATDIKCPEFKKDEKNIWNWYIYTAGQLKFLADFVNNGNSLNGTENGADLTNYVTEANYDPSTVTMTTDTTIYLMNNLDLGARPGVGTTEEEKWATNPDELKWMPIGIDSANVRDKLGTFEGNNHTICGVYVNRDTTFNGIFGSSNTIQNLIIRNSYIQGKAVIGGIVGWNYGEMRNCHNNNAYINSKSEETSMARVGGIVGVMVGSIEKCTNDGIVIGKTGYIGGIVGLEYPSSTISECNNNGKIEGNTGVGGIAGGCRGTIINECNNNGKIEGNTGVGGIAGICQGTINECNNTGNIEGEEVGGIVGRITYGSKIEECNNTGNITGKGECSGGIVGAIPTDDKDPSDKEPAVIRKCYNSGNIRGNTYTGGVVGAVCQYNSLVEKCYNIGEVNGSRYEIGGIVGMLNRSSKVYNCYNMNKVIGVNIVGGIVGVSFQSQCEIKNCYNIGKVSGTSDVGGILGRNHNSSTIVNSYYLTGTATLDEGSGTTNNLAKSKEYITQDFVTTANNEEENWKVETGKNDGWPILNE